MCIEDVPPGGVSLIDPARGGDRRGELRFDARSLLVVFVVTAPPDPVLVAPAWRPVEPLVHAPEPVQPAGIGRVRVVDGAIVEGERAHAGSLSRVGRPIRAEARCD